MGSLVPAVPQWLEDLIQRYAGPQQGNPQFETIVASGAKAESGWDPFKIQKNGNGRGLFQFDMSKGAMGYGVPLSDLFNPDYQASRIVPVYAQQYTRWTGQGLTGATLAANVAGSAERPYGYNPTTGVLAPNTAAFANYVAAFNEVTGTLGQAIPIPVPPIPAPGQTTPAPSSPGGGGVTTPAPAPPTGGGSGANSLNFSDSLFHVLASGGLVLLAIALILGGIWLLTSSKDLNVTTVIPRASGRAGAGEGTAAKAEGAAESGVAEAAA